MKVALKLALLTMFLSLTPAAFADPITVDFDALDAHGVPGGYSGSGLDAYLNSFGITVSDVTSGTI